MENLKRLAGNQGFAVTVREADAIFCPGVLPRRRAAPACDAAADAPLSPPQAGITLSLLAGTLSAPATGAGDQPDADVLLHAGQRRRSAPVRPLMNAGVKLPPWTTRWSSI